MEFFLITLIAFLLSLISIIVAKDAIILIFGVTFSESVRIFTLLSVSLAFYLIRSVIEIGYIAVHLERQYLYANLVAAFLYTFLIPILVLQYGLEGAGYAAIFAEGMTLAFHIFYYKLIPVLFAVKILAIPAFSFCVALVGVFFVNELMPLVHVSIPCVLYIFMLFVFKGIHLEEIKMASLMILGKS